MKTVCTLFTAALLFSSNLTAQQWIRTNHLGYLPVSVKVAVYISQSEKLPDFFLLKDAITGKTVFRGKPLLSNGSYWGMNSAARLDFSSVETEGGYYLEMGSCRSDYFRISANAYKGTADFILRYMRQQRCGYNPWLDDSCHTHDGFIVDHPSRSGELIDARGGWHDASDYLQYVNTTANAVYQMMYAYTLAPEVYGDIFDANGRKGANGIPDILDEAKWGMDWLIRMNPDSGEMYNQLADDRDHRGFRLPNQDTASYGNGLYRPVYFVTGKPQGLAKYKNRTEGVSSVAGKYASAFALGSTVLGTYYPDLSKLLPVKATDAWEFALTDIGTTQTACNVSPYFYEEDNYTDDLQLAAWELFKLTGREYFLNQADYWGAIEQVTPWIEKDTARHYQFYPFVNMGHANLALSSTTYSSRYKWFMNKGLSILGNRRTDDPFRISVPFTWCSNNFVNAALTQHLLYAGATGDKSYATEEAALRDWLFGTNPWGTSMICGLPEGSDYPRYPHSAFTLHLGVTTEGGLIDGPVWSRIFKNLRGVGLLRPDEYSAFQNGQAVYHDDIGDYSTNEPTMDGTADLSIPLALIEKEGKRQSKAPEGEVRDSENGIVRLDKNEKCIYLLFPADEFGDGIETVIETLAQRKIKGSFFLTGNFLRNPGFKRSVMKIVAGGHYLGPHSDKHLLYNSWEKRDSLLVSREQFTEDLIANYREIEKGGVSVGRTRWFLPPYEWYNSDIVKWSEDLGCSVINFTPGTGTNADYTTPGMQNYRSSDILIEKLKSFESEHPDRLNGAFLLIHPGTDPGRTDKLYNRLGEIIDYYTSKGYTFKKL